MLRPHERAESGRDLGDDVRRALDEYSYSKSHLPWLTIAAAFVVCDTVTHDGYRGVEIGSIAVARSPNHI